MSSENKDPSGRSGKLAALFRNVLSGKKNIESAHDAKLFFEAARSRPSPSSCMEEIVASRQGLGALQFSLRVDLSPAFIKTQALLFISYLIDDQLKLLANGHILQTALLAIAQPALLWNALLNLVKSDGLDEHDLRTFSWLCLELLPLSKTAEIDVYEDIEAIARGRKFLDAPCPRTRAFGYKIEQSLQLLKSPGSKAEASYAPGGRHDNDHENFREISVYPTTDEFLSVIKPFYRRAKEVFETDMSERPAMHLDNIYRLTREDLLGELRNDWQNVHVRKRGGGSALTLQKLAPKYLDLGSPKRRKKCSLAISCMAGLEGLQSMHPNQRKKWLTENKGFLRHQAFGALHQGQEIFGFAFIDRDEDALTQSPPIITLQFTDENAFKKALLAFKTAQNAMFTLVDTPVFAYEPVLERLKDMMFIPLHDKLLDPANAVDDFVPDPAILEFTKSLSSAKASAEVKVQKNSSEKKFQLDHTQLQSLVNALTHKTSVIQGPPGTGKSFIGALATYFLLKFTQLRILVITYTNHALDQFLEDLEDMGIDADKMVRLGSKYTANTASMLLSTQRSEYRRGKDSWAVIDKLKENAESQGQELRNSFTGYLRAQPSFNDIQDYLEFSDDDTKFFGAFTIPTEAEGYVRVGKKGKDVKQDFLFNNWKAGDGPGIFRQHALKHHKDIWDIDPSQRKKLVDKWFMAILKEKAQCVQERARQYNLTQEKMDSQFRERKVQILRGKRIIGCTTTAAAMFTKLITAAEPGVVIVEEAGEIQESHVLTALTSTVNQLILIGDHKQLRPKINNYNLTVEKGDGFDLNRSPIERLILQGHPYTTLQKQHRMHPSISVLVRELTYPDLEDGLKTELRPTIRGLEGRVIFMNHDHPEVQDKKIADRRDQGAKSSKENKFEAEMVLKTVKFLSQQGYGTGDMVVLTPYLGQLRRIKKMLNDDVELGDLDSRELIRAGLMTQAAANVNKKQLRLSTIDNYQGEEADIVIVSLTRSNNDGDIGFLAARERLNVLISRARNCLIMFGNMATYMSSKKGKETWVPFFESLKAKQYLYDGLPVKCEKHPDTKSLLKVPDDFDRCCPDGGCAEPCGAILNCNRHTCQMRCHRVTDHSKMPCPHKVEKTCDRGHKLKVSCHDYNDRCSKCVKEDKEMERRVKRDLKLEEDRQAHQAAYKRDLLEIQDEIDHQRRLIRQQKDREDQQKILAQQRADLAELKDTAERVRNAPNLQPPIPGSFPSRSPPTPPSGLDNGLDIPQGAEEEWEYLKKFEGANSKPLDELMNMIGLETVKSEFLEIKTKVDTALRQNIPLSKERYGCTMLGNPGTGKTTVARLYAKFLTSIGAIAGSCFKEETGASLASAGVNGCKQIINDILNDGGGVLFIDEAYQLTSGNSHGGGAVLDYLLPEVENLSGKVAFIVAGYNKQMETFFAHNPGLPSRFPIEMKFEDYKDDELLRIFELNIYNKYGGRMKCEDGLRGLYCRIITRRVGRARGKEGFGNARTISNTVATVTKRQSTRLARERRAGKKPDDFFLTKEDLIGPEPTEALAQSKAWKDLQKLTGLKSVKDAVKALVDSVKQNYQRELDEQPPIEFTLNRVFLGNPGTGKTTVAKLYGKILVDLGMLSKGEVIVKNPSDFVGSVLGESEKLTKGILAASLGKVLVIDEAYGLCDSQGSASSIYKTAVIDTIVAEVQSVPGDDRCVLLLGYKDQMEDMFQNVNPGLSRRFPISSAFEFEDFTDNELRSILNMKLNQQGYSATDQAKQVAMEILGRARNRPNFGNAGEIDIMLDATKARHQSRLSKNLAKGASVLDAQDFDEDFDRAERADTDVAKLFKDTVGNEDTINLLRGYQQDVKTMKSLDMDPKENIPFNFLFKGPPGTGKTTTAKKMGKVFYDMGFLSTAEVIECSATDLIGQYVGQTGPKVQQQLDKALGRVLFIDEAYRLAEGHFAKEAMDELVDAVTKDKYAKKLIIILAGYESDINRLMTTNAGLTSRFPEVINFRSLTPDECIKLLLQEMMRHKANLESKKKHLDISALESVNKPSRTTNLYQLFLDLSKADNWASARDVKEVGKAIFRKILKDKAGLADGHLVLGIDIIETELKSMLQERRSRSMNIALRPLSGLDGLPVQLPPDAENPRLATGTATKLSTVQRPPTPSTDEDDAPEGGKVEIVKETILPRRGVAVRDAGVSDEVWEQLQRDGEAEEQRDREYQQLLKAQQTARDEAREKIVKRLLEEEKRRKEEAEAQMKLQMMGACPVGYAWIKQAGGYRCAGGSHFMSDASLM